jgi:prevent-host-death family protein
MNEQTISVAEAKRHFPELLGKVAHGKEQILITKRGKPMARLVPAEQVDRHLSKAKGWLEEKDPFFETIDRIVHDRTNAHTKGPERDILASSAITHASWLQPIFAIFQK